jgi:hypothetical protein
MNMPYDPTQAPEHSVWALYEDAVRGHEAALGALREAQERTLDPVELAMFESAVDRAAATRSRRVSMLVPDQHAVRA